MLNLGVDGVMLLGGFGGYYTVLETGNHLLGILVGLGIGLAMGIVYGIATVVLQAQQGISGIGIFLFGLGFSDLLFRELVGTPRPIKALPKVKIPLLGDIPHLGEALFNHNLLVYIAFGLVPATTWLLMKTTFGLNVRAVGENPQAADSLGVSVAWTRFYAILIGNGMAGLAGAASLNNSPSSSTTSPTGSDSSPWHWCTSAPGARWVMAGALLYGLVGQSASSGSRSESFPATCPTLPRWHRQ